MNDEEQRRSKILIADREGGIKGWGFLVDLSHVMTCAHVVRDCLPGRPSRIRVGDRLLGTRDDGRPPFELKVVTDPAELADSDVCVLQLDGASRFPEGYAPVRWQKCESGLGFIGSGMVKIPAAADAPARIEEVTITGDVGTLMLRRETRYIVNSSDPDTRIAPGCSGAPVFATGGDRGVIGMVAEYRQARAGSIVHDTALRDCWPALCKDQDADPGLISLDPRPADGIHLADLDEKLPLCDREDQTGPFAERVGRLAAARKGALLTTIDGGEDDLPDQLSIRLCELGPARFVRRRTTDAGEADMRRQLPFFTVDMFKCRTTDDAEMRAKIAWRLQTALGSGGTDAKSFARTIKALRYPAIVKVLVTDDYVADHGLVAARAWTDLAHEICGHDLSHPLFVFFFLTRSAGAGDATLIERWRIADGAFLILDTLTPIDRREVKTWAENCYRPLSAKIMALVENKAAGQEQYRLKTLSGWLTGQ